jgi:hypothetical protein
LGSGDESTGGTLGRIALKQVRVSREEHDARQAAGKQNPSNLLVPYLDLFSRLNNEELGRLANVDPRVVGQLRKQVNEINKALKRYCDLLPRLSDNELTRLTGASAKTIRFWRLCQPRTAPAQGQAKAAATPQTQAPEAQRQHGTSASGVHTPGVPKEAPVSRTPPPVSEPPTPAQGTPAAVPTQKTPDPSASQNLAAATLASVEGDPFPGFEERLLGPDEGGEIEIGSADEPPEPDPGKSKTEMLVEDDDDEDLAFELSDDDFF